VHLVRPLRCIVVLRGARATTDAAVAAACRWCLGSSSLVVAIWLVMVVVVVVVMIVIMVREVGMIGVVVCVTPGTIGIEPTPERSTKDREYLAGRDFDLGAVAFEADDAPDDARRGHDVVADLGRIRWSCVARSFLRCGRSHKK
jgi:hypothetical protein